MKIKNWIVDREGTGRPCFSRDEVAGAFPSLSASSIDSSLSRFRSNGLIQAVHRGFYCVIPAHYAYEGKVPPGGKAAPTAKEFLADMEGKLAVPEYCDDVRLMLRPGTDFYVDTAYSFVKDNFIGRMTTETETQRV